MIKQKIDARVCVYVCMYVCIGGTITKNLITAYDICGV